MTDSYTNARGTRSPDQSFHFPAKKKLLPLKIRSEEKKKKKPLCTIDLEKKKKSTYSNLY